MRFAVYGLRKKIKERCEVYGKDLIEKYLKPQTAHGMRVNKDKVKII